MRWALAVPAVALLVWAGLRAGGGDRASEGLAELPVLTSDELVEITDADVMAYLEEGGGTIDLEQVDVELNDDEMLAYLATQDVDLTELITELE